MKRLLKPQGSIVSYEESLDEGEYDIVDDSKGLKGVVRRCPFTSSILYFPTPTFLFESARKLAHH